MRDIIIEPILAEYFVVYKALSHTISPFQIVRTDIIILLTMTKNLIWLKMCQQLLGVETRTQSQIFEVPDQCYFYYTIMTIFWLMRSKTSLLILNSCLHLISWLLGCTLIRAFLFTRFTLNRFLLFLTKRPNQIWVETYCIF